MNNSDAETLKAIFYKVAIYLDYSEQKELEELIYKIQKESRRQL